MPVIPSANRRAGRLPEKAWAVNRPAEPACLRVPTSASTHAGFRAWATSGDLPERLRVAYIDGEIYLDMSNEDPETHVGVKAEITRTLMNLNRTARLGKLYADGVLLSSETTGLSSNPDAIFLRR